MKRPSTSVWPLIAIGLAAACTVLMLPVSAFAGSSVLDLSVEELLQVKVTSPSKKAQLLEDVPAAVHVLTSEELGRSGVTSIPDALRLVPGLQVARIDASKWAVSCRGFNERFANKMLVLVDGRSVYAELFAGVFWEALDVLIEDVERIEVIRGPGASVWGANAVNGVVNIITKSAEQTTGRFVQAGGASRDRRAVAVRRGGRAGGGGSYRIYAKYTQHDPLESAEGDLLADQWHSVRGGFRCDWTRSSRTDLSLTGEMYGGRCGSDTWLPQLTPPYTVETKSRDWSAGHSLRSRWTHRPSGRSEVAVQAYYMHLLQGYERLLSLDADDVDLEVTHNLTLGRGYSLTSGLGYRVSSVRTEGGEVVRFDPADATSRLANAFTQCNLRLWGDRLHLLGGTKVEHKSQSGWEVQPTFRTLCRVHERHSLWASASRAVRTPSRAEQASIFINRVVAPDAGSPGAPAIVVKTSSSPEYGSEELWAFELGYRGSSRSRLRWDLTAFQNQYDHLRSGQRGDAYTVEGQPYLYVPFTTGNDLKGWTRGLEVSSVLQLTPWCRLGADYTHLYMRCRPRGGASSDTNTSGLGNDPGDQISAHASLDLGRRFQVWGALRHVGALPNPRIPAYLVGDLTTQWKWSPHVTVMLGVRDIGSGNRREFESVYIQTRPATIPTDLFCYLNLRY